MVLESFDLHDRLTTGKKMLCHNEKPALGTIKRARFSTRTRNEADSVTRAQARDDGLAHAPFPEASRASCH